MMNGAILLIPVILIRYVLLFFVNRQAFSRAAHFPPMRGTEKVMYFLYQASTLAIIIYLFFTSVSLSGSSLYVGIVVYALGAVLLALSEINYAKPDRGICQRGLYRVSRNPMYVAYFICFLGCVLLTQSIILLGIVIVFQVSSHWMILSEERWCIEQYGEEYRSYMRKVRRYI